jgi:hypothetical protein
MSKAHPLDYNGNTQLMRILLETTNYAWDFENRLTTALGTWWLPPAAS